MIFNWRAISLGLIAALLPIGSVHAGMHTPGKFDVSALGAATYTLPIQAPPGTAGMVPNLAFSFNSQAGGGLLGKGWSLSGLSSITRCSSTPAQDGGVLGGVNYDMNDRFCLDGQRLMVSNGGVYGASGTEYRMERENFSKIVSYNAAGNGPAWFQVWTKSGQMMEFGGTEDSRIEVQGKSTVRIWALNRVQDAKTNFITVTYTEDNENGDFYPQSINYTGNSNALILPNSSVQFKYETRPDIVAMYQAGSMVKSSVRLSHVETYVNSARVLDYRLAYFDEPADPHTRLSDITQCDGAGTNCLPPTKFKWNESSIGPFASGTWLRTGSLTDTNSPVFEGALNGESSFLIGDINGDGKTDLVQLSYINNTLWLLPIVSNGAGLIVGAWYNTGWVARAQLAADVNGDGKTDIVLMIGGYGENAKISILPIFYNGSSFDNGTLYDTGLPYKEGPWSAMDVNGDGKSDLVQTYTLDGDVWLLTILSNGTSFTPGSWVYQSSRSVGKWSDVSVKMIPLDINGDGKMDFVEVWYRFASHGNIWLQPHFSNGSGFSAGNWYDTGLLYFDASKLNIAEILAADLNGDGMSDLVVVNKTYNYPGATIVELFPFFSNGIDFVRHDSFWVNSVWYYPPQMTAGQTFVADLNGDGRMDIIQSWITPKNEYDQGPMYAGELWLQPIISSEKMSFLPKPPYNTHQDGNTTHVTVSDSEGNYVLIGAGPGLIVMDINGDGKLDLVQQKYDGDAGNVSLFTYFVDDKIGDLLSTITSGTGATINISYKPLTDDNLYVRDGQATYPLANMQMPLYAVSSFAASNGRNGANTVTYTYGGLKKDWSRNSLVGFRWTQSQQVETGMINYTEYRQDWPYAGMVSSQRQNLASAAYGGLLNKVTNSFGCNDFVNAAGCKPVPGRNYFPYVEQSVAFSFDLNGAVLPATTTTVKYDAWGNATQVVKTSVDGSNAFSTVTNHLYDEADLTNWLIGNVQRSVVTNSSHPASQAPFPSGPVGAWPGGPGSGGPVSGGAGDVPYAASSTVWVAGYPQSNSISVGQALQMKVQVSGLGALTGSVTFMDGSTVLGEKAIDANGFAALSVAFSKLGEHVITAVYSGNTNNSSSAAVSTVKVNVNIMPILMMLLEDDS